MRGPAHPFWRIPPISEQQLLPERVISGGQTGADQAGLIAARRFGSPTGGWMPKGFLTVTGPAPELAREFGLREHTGSYADRTETNVRLADGTLRFAASFETLGEKCTLKWLRHHRKPFMDIDLAAPPPVEQVADWIRSRNIRVRNVAGNAEPKSTSIVKYALWDSRPRLSSPTPVGVAEPAEGGWSPCRL